MSAKIYYVWAIDHDDLIIDINNNWTDFAKENKANHLVSNTVIGTCLWDHIKDFSTRQIYQSLAEKVRSTSSTATVSYRCDSPDLKRYMQMDIIPRERNHVEFKSHVIKTEPTPHVDLLDSDKPRLEELVVVCSWCKKVKIEGKWVDIIEAMLSMDIFNKESVPVISHGMCESCLEEKYPEIKDEVKKGMQKSTVN